jgi:hypothetical protein
MNAITNTNGKEFNLHEKFIIRNKGRTGKT